MSEIIHIETDIPLLCERAAAFPADVEGAWTRLHGKLAARSGRVHFGLSRPEDGGGIQYRAASLQLPEDDARTLQLERLVLPKGRYAAVLIENFMSHIPAIGRTFQALLHQPGIDPQGYCVERYEEEGKNVRCMVRLDS